MSIDAALLPTQAEIEHYRSHGWYLSRPLFTEAELDAAIEGSERYYAALDGPRIDLPNGRTFDVAWWKGAGADQLRKNDYTTLLVPELAAL